MSEVPPRAATSGHVQRKRAARVQRILHTAAAVFAEKGYDGAGLEEIATRLDMRGPSLYHYFSSKDELLTGCIDHTAAAVNERVRAVAEAGGPARERLRRMFAEQALVQLRDFPEFIPLFLRLRVPEGPLRDHIHALRAEHGDLFRKVAGEAQAAGELGGADATLALMLAFGALSYVQEWYHPGDGLAAEPLADHIADRLIRLFDEPSAGPSPPIR